MNLKQKHILAVSAVAGIAGLIGYLIGSERGYERGLSDGIDESKDAPKTTVEKLNEILKKSLGNKSETLPHWKPSPFDISLEGPSLRGRTADKLIWDELDLNNINPAGEYYIKPIEPDKFMYDPELNKKADDYIKQVNYYKSDDDVEEDEEDTDDESDIENIRTQGEVEYTSKEPYLVTEDDVFTDETNPDDVEQLTYYKIDDVLADSFDEVITEKSLVLGSISKEFLQGLDGGETIYIRNPITKRDYEIFIKDASYEQEVIGADEEQYRNAVKFFKLGDE